MNLEEEDEICIQNILKGNTKSEEYLYDKYKKQIKSYLKKKYTSHNDIDDDVSEIMIKVFLNIDKYDKNKSRFRSWVFSIAKNHMIDKWKSNHTNTTLSGNGLLLTTSIDFFSDSSNSLHDLNNELTVNYTCFENDNYIHHLSKQITEHDYELLNMKYIQGYNYNEIGLKYNITSSTVSNRINYIKSKLKKNNIAIE